MSKKTKIAFIVPVCSRGQKWTSVTDSPIVKTFLSSAMNTIAPEDFDSYDFECYIGFDDDDVYFTDENNRDTIKKAFIAKASGANGRIVPSFHSFSDTKHNPCRCWNHLAQIAVDNGADYLYQTGDDVNINTKGWATVFVSALESTGNVGVAAPRDLGYYGLYTQSFVHKRHIEIMGTYFPENFKNWYIDDFTTGVYKPCFNHYCENYTISNTGGPQRYNADDAQPLLIEAVVDGQIKLAKWLKKNDSQFDLDSYKAQAVTVHEQYEEVSKTMTTAPAKPFWSAAVKIFNNAWEREIG